MKKRREKPLFSMEEICRMNGVEYDASRPSDSVTVEFADGECMKIDSTFNLFDKRYLPVSTSVSIRNEVDSSWVMPVQYSDPAVQYRTKKYKKADNISRNVDYSYHKESQRYIFQKTNVNHFTAA